MKRSLVSRVLAVMMVLALALSCFVGCEKKPTEDTSVNVALEMYYQAGTTNDHADVWAKINDYLSKSEINVKINANAIGNADYKDKMTSLIASGAVIDLMNCNSDLPVATLVGMEALADLTEAIKYFGNDINEIVGANALAACSSDGSIYAVPMVKEWSNMYGVSCSIPALKHFGLYDRWTAMTWSTMGEWNDLYYAFRDARDNDTTYFTAVRPAAEYDLSNEPKEEGKSYGWFHDYNTMTVEEVAALTGLGEITKGLPIAHDWASGALDEGGRINALDVWLKYDKIGATGIGFDVSAKEAKATNFFASADYLTAAKTLEKWYKDGLFLHDDEIAAKVPYALKNQNLGMIFYHQGQVFAAKSYFGGFCQEEFHLVPQNAVVVRDSVLGSSYAVGYKSEHVNRAVMYLNFICKDATINNMYNYGFAGDHYNLDENGQVVFTEKGKDGNYWGTSSYNTGLSGNLFIRYSTAGNPTNVWDMLKATNKVQSPFMAFEFDNTAVTDIISAIANTVGIYDKNVRCVTIPDGYTVESYIAEFNKELEKDGLATLLAAIDNQYAAK